MEEEQSSPEENAHFLGQKIVLTEHMKTVWNAATPNNDLAYHIYESLRLPMLQKHSF